MNARVKKVLKYVLSFSLAAALLFLSFREVDWKEFFRVLSSCHLGTVALAMAAGITAFFFRGLRWKQMLLPLDSSTKAITTVDGVNISNVANMVIPFSGELVRCGVVTRHSSKDASFDKVFGTAALERVWDVITVLILLIVLLVFKWDMFGAFIFDKMWAPLLERFHGGIWLLLAAVAILMAAAVLFVIKSRSRSRLAGRIYSFCSGIVKGFASCFKMKKKALFFFFTVVIWGMYWLQIELLFKAMPGMLDLTVIDSLFIMLVGSFASIVPVPGGFGAYHYLVSMALFSIYGFPQAGVGIIFATLSHESQAITMLLSGGVSYVVESFRNKKAELK